MQTLPQHLTGPPLLASHQSRFSQCPPTPMSWSPPHVPLQTPDLHQAGFSHIAPWGNLSTMLQLPLTQLIPGPYFAQSVELVQVGG